MTRAAYSNPGLGENSERAAREGPGADIPALQMNYKVHESWYRSDVDAFSSFIIISYSRNLQLHSDQKHIEWSSTSAVSRGLVAAATVVQLTANVDDVAYPRGLVSPDIIRLYGWSPALPHRIGGVSAEKPCFRSRVAQGPQALQPDLSSSEDARDLEGYIQDR